MWLTHCAVPSAVKPLTSAREMTIWVAGWPVFGSITPYIGSSVARLMVILVPSDPLPMKSRPWSKNWPNNTNQPLTGATPGLVAPMKYSVLGVPSSLKAGWVSSRPEACRSP
ncbi:hypothetical protein Y695_03126 [Hydrogenophaga sp. T4]|nr:hypothetical protein Y695_03126 [Hydrogenophaga sp. T4]